MILAAAYTLSISILGIYSYALINPNITFFQHSLWVAFRDPLVQFGYYNREGSWYVYLILVILLFILSAIAVKNHKIIDPRKVSLIIGIVLLFSYPFLSHDFFNYMFDAKILTYYHQNPYLLRALDFPTDQWTRFMHWTHRTYPYGPVFLLLSLIPSLLGFGKFTLSFLLFKAFFILYYGVSVYLLNKLNKKWAVMFATHPLIIIEGLVSSHNDIVALALGVVGVYFILKKKKVGGALFLLFSAGIKYINLPLILLSLRGVSAKPDDVAIFIRLLRRKLAMTLANLSFTLQLIILIYLSFKMEIQPWYFLALFAFLPYFAELISNMNIFFFGLLMSYYPYIRLGGWDTAEKVNFKHQIIFIFFLINVFYLCLTFLLKRYKSLYKVETRI